MSGTKKVNEFIAKLEHPLKAEMEAVRNIITKTNPEMEEDIKWGGPSFYYKEDMATFNPRIKNYVAVIFHKGSLIANRASFFEDAPKGKVYAKFYSMADVEANKTALEQLVKGWVTAMDQH
jgi:hypothetical protein